MGYQRRSRYVFVLLCMLLSAALLGGCGSPTETISPATGTILSASTPTAGLNTCVNCHTLQTADWLTSKHANLDPAGDLYSYGVPTIGQISGCANCHDPNGDSNNLTPGYTGALDMWGNLIKRPVISCESCHGPGSLHVNAGGMGPISLLSNTTGAVLGSGPTVTVSGQFVMCTSCHELLNSSTGGLNTSPTHSTSPLPNGAQYVIMDTHSASTGSWVGPPNGRTNLAGYGITGYAMDFAGDTVCTDCHNPHKSADINREWADSKHANKDFKGPWAHYNWSTLKACQRCHTATGFAAYADALEGGNVTLAEAIRTGTIVSAPVASTATWKPEMLKCNGCHKDNRGNLRNPGAYKATYTIGTAPNAKVTYQYSDLGASNVCMTCHTGRNSGKAINQLNTGQTGTVNFGNYGYSNVDGHYLTAGGTMFKGTGFEFTGRSYTNPASFKHYEIGTSAVPNTGAGPCIGCHMYRAGLPGNHLFEPVSDVSGTITNVSSEICYNCHPGSSTSLAAMIDQEKKNYEDALAALQAQLAGKGFYFIPEYSASGLGSFPYFFTAPGPLAEWQTLCSQNVPVMNFQTGGTTSCSGSVPSCTCTGNGNGTPGTGKNNMGAAFNMSLLHHEPGGYVHNSRYVKRLIYDSIDWMDDGQLNYSVAATLGALPGATSYKAGAMNYLLQSDPKGYGTYAERP